MSLSFVLQKYQLSFLFAVFLGALALNMSCGPVTLPWFDFFHPHKSLDDVSGTLLLWRFSHALAVSFVGAALALAGSVLQRVLRNALADPFVLGVTSGGTLFAVGSILLGAPFFFMGVPVRVLAALLGSALTLVLVLFANRFFFRGEGSFGIPLAGMLLNAFFGALLTFLLSVVDPGRLGESFRWLIGDIQPLSLVELTFVGVFLFFVSLVLLRLSTAIGALAFGDDFATSLGFRAARLRLVAVVMAALLTAVVVSFAGSVGFVGLVVPHAARWFVRGHIAREWVGSLLLGSTLVLFADIMARTVLSPSELPVGIFTALMGVPLLVAMALRKGGARDASS